jgi:quercetin dioxygenase-like cupin family protein
MARTPFGPQGEGDAHDRPPTFQLPSAAIDDLIEPLEGRVMAKIVQCSLKCALALVAVACTGAVFAQDMAKVAPKNTKVLVDNDQVRVMEVTLRPGDRLPMHSHPANVVYFVTGGKTKTTLADGKVTETEHKAGEAMWSEPVTHSNENSGNSAAKALVVELKAAK